MAKRRMLKSVRNAVEPYISRDAPEVMLANIKYVRVESRSSPVELDEKYAMGGEGKCHWK